MEGILKIDLITLIIGPTPSTAVTQYCVYLLHSNYIEFVIIQNCPHSSPSGHVLIFPAMSVLSSSKGLLE